MRLVRLIVGIQFSLLSNLLFIQANAVADEGLEPVLAKIVISEILTETANSANEEFVEITNVSGETIDISGWAIQYRAATGTSWSDKALLSGSIYPEGSLVISTQGFQVDLSVFFWSGTGGQLAASGGNLRLQAPNSVDAEDTVAWGTGIYGETLAAIKPAKGNSISRIIESDKLQDTNNNLDDFRETAPNPINENTPPVDPEDTDETSEENTDEETTNTEDQEGQDDQEQPTDNTDPEDDQAEEDENETTPTPILLNALTINELMINPKSPELDSEDEWIELFNNNDQAFNLDGYKIQTGSSYNYSYLFVDGLIQPFGYFTLYSSVSNLALTNSSGGVRLIDPSGLIHGQAVEYEDVEEGNTYALDGDGLWHWTTTPTPLSSNLFTEAPVVVKVANVKTAKTTTPKNTTKVAATKASTTKKSTTSAKATANLPTSTGQIASSNSEDPATRPWVLASFGSLAVTYGLYEYRDDVTNKFRKLRRYYQVWRKGRSAM